MFEASLKLSVAKLSVAALLVASAVGCGGAGPIPDTTLTGKVGGTTFTAVGAIASPGFDEGERSIIIADVALTCADRFKSLDRQLLFSTPWTEGRAVDFGFGTQTVTFVTGGSNNNISLDGRLEIVSAPTAADSKGKIKLRAKAGDDSVEGTVDVLVCPEN